MRTREKPPTIAAVAAAVMAESGFTVIWWGDIALLEEIARRAGKSYRHPQILVSRILDGIARDQEFEAGYIRHAGRRTRAFRWMPRAGDGPCRA